LLMGCIAGERQLGNLMPTLREDAFSLGCSRICARNAE
jgi:hypothetical protein